MSYEQPRARIARIRKEEREETHAFIKTLPKTLNSVNHSLNPLMNQQSNIDRELAMYYHPPIR